MDIMDKTLENLRIQQDCMWMLNFMANSKRDEIAKAGGIYCDCEEHETLE